MGKITPAQHKFTKNEDGSYTVDIKKEEIGKITGTHISGVVSKSIYKTPFSTACVLLGLFDEDISDKPSVKAGKILEEPILKYMNDTGILPNIPAQKELEQGAHDDWVQNFEHPIFGGHFDARTPDGHIVEVKTTSNPQDWRDEEGNRAIPEHYWLQASLYAHFLGTDKIHFVVSGMTYESVTNPYGWTPNSYNTITFETGLYPDFDKVLEQAEEFYHTYLEQGRTPAPDMNNPIDQRIVAIIDAQSRTNEEMQDLLSKYETAKVKAKELEALAKDATADMNDLEEQLRMFLETHKEGVSSINTYYHIVKGSRKSVDTDRLKKDGLYDKYAKVTETSTLKADKLIG